MAPVAAAVTAALVSSAAWFEGAHWEPISLAPGASPTVPGWYVGPAPTAAASPFPTSAPATDMATTSQGSCGTGYVACDTPAAFVCIGNGKFGICAMNGCALAQDLAQGVTCAAFMPNAPQLPAPAAASTFATVITSTPTVSSSAVSTFVPGAKAPEPAPSQPASSQPTGTHKSSVGYNTYAGGPSNFPDESQWVSSFEEMWTQNLDLIKNVCYIYGSNSDVESADVKTAIQTAASGSGLDPRFVLAVVMQESRGCVRVITTFGSHANPGLLQDYDGPATCRPMSATPLTPCPTTEIDQMIDDGVYGDRSPGEAKGYGLQEAYERTANLSLPSTAARYYTAARLYNSGSFTVTNLGCGAGTSCYTSDIANRLLGWTGDGSQCNNAAVAAACAA